MQNVYDSLIVVTKQNIGMMFVDVKLKQKQNCTIVAVCYESFLFLFLFFFFFDIVLYVVSGQGFIFDIE